MIVSNHIEEVSPIWREQILLLQPRPLMESAIVQLMAHHRFISQDKFHERHTQHHVYLYHVNLSLHVEERKLVGSWHLIDSFGLPL